MTIKNLEASVQARLQNHARATKRPFQELLQYYAMERFPYRLSKTLLPIARACASGESFDRRWSPGGPWTTSS